MSDDYNRALRDELMRAIMADPRGFQQGRPPGVGPENEMVPPMEDNYEQDWHGPRHFKAGAHGMISPEKIRNPGRAPALPMKPDVSARMEALAGARGLVGGGMSKPNELEAARNPAALSELLKRMPPEQRMALIQKLQGLSGPTR